MYQRRRPYTTVVDEDEGDALPSSSVVLVVARIDRIDPDVVEGHLPIHRRGPAFLLSDPSPS